MQLWLQICIFIAATSLLLQPGGFTEAVATVGESLIKPSTRDHMRSLLRAAMYSSVNYSYIMFPLVAMPLRAVYYLDCTLM
ncbi:b124.1 [miniopterid betaherpesvirus 1]|uniref:B124.1 n=1 Tax=miniopterid betaherpesvirus 1 TaxID=3070189 RepID=I3VQC0_9BETA|nr:b124.1 [miniopterid betaherpesvirus 1]AFK83964.1 b124.1 [miniopterid betaherpesvirus 1]